MRVLLKAIGVGYRNLLKPVLFRTDAEWIHEFVVGLGEFLGRLRLFSKPLKKIFFIKAKSLEQNICGIDFMNPAGLAAGFDYEARLTQITSAVGFGFSTVGTITNMPYVGNPKPRLSRLPKSKALLINKGFKNPGAKAAARKLKHLHFDIPIGISVGRTNAPLTQEQSIKDIISAFETLEKAQLDHAYYELNISCPNLYGSASFYGKDNLERLLSALAEARIKKPVFVKMPVSRPDNEVLDMLDVILRHKIAGAIFGNLAKDRNNPAIDQEEIKDAGAGSISGAPAEKRSTELTRLAYRHCGKKLVIIGCGGIFSAKDAYKKIKNGASLVQLITGMIYQGPQLMAEINLGLAELLKRDGYKHISQAVGADVNT